MKKFYYLFFLSFILFSSGVWAQPGSILYYQDFDSTGNAANNFLPVGWSVSDITGNGYVWKWNDTASVESKHTASIGLFNSTSASNGYLVLPSSYYNANSSTTTNMYSAVESGAISITPTSSVMIEFEQFYSLCCGSFSLTVEVSPDGVNWTQYYNKSSGSANQNQEHISLDVSSTLGGQNTAYIRFTQHGASFYFWMIDDLFIREGYTDAFDVGDFTVSFSDLNRFNPNYTVVPPCADFNLTFSGIVNNIGTNALTGVETEVSIFQDSTIGGAPGVGLVYQATGVSPNSIPSMGKDTVSVVSPPFSILNSGYSGKFTALIDVRADSTNQLSGGSIEEYKFEIRDTVFARDRGEFNQSVGAATYLGGDTIGSRMGVLYSIEQMNSISASSISCYIANDTSNVGVNIQAQVWGFDGSSPTISSSFSSTPLASSQNAVTITTGMLGKWVSMPLSSPLPLVNGNQYVAAIEQVSGTVNNKFFSLGRDTSMEKISPSSTNFVYVAKRSSVGGNPGPDWGWVLAVPGIRLNVKGGGCLVGVSEMDQVNGEISFSPNPANNIITFQSSPLNDGEKEIRFYGVNGKLHLSRSLTFENGGARVDISKLDAGVYFAYISDENGKWVEKIVIQ